MLRKILIIAFIVLCSSAFAKSVETHVAKKVATIQLQKLGYIKADDTLSLAFTQQAFLNGETINTLYVFNFSTEGFVIVSGDDCCTPVLGYSRNGSFDASRLPVNMKSWLDQYSSDIVEGLKQNPVQNAETRKMWEDALNEKFTIPASPKSDNYLVQSTWEQGYGYNKYCPVYQGQNVVVGCVATAMAQIIRYYEYPRRGFGQKSYVHPAYGTISVDFDTTDYDYDLMPMHVSWYADEDEIDMVSRLCYHCGIVVNMTYEWAEHTSGSGAHTSKVPEGLMHFGYTDAQHLVRTVVNNDVEWRNMIINEIDALRPIEYSGFGGDGGHAFILDGYNGNKYHFNWGWGGYGDGFYTLTTMQGFVNTHEMVINIKPSGWDGHAERFLVSPDGNGDGTSWEQANSNIDAAIKLNTLDQRDIWMKEGVYYGDTTSDFAYYWYNIAATIVGGFEGTETAVNQRTPDLHPTIFDGQNVRSILYALNGNSRQMKISDIVLQNGFSTSMSNYLSGNITANFITVRNCSGSESAAICVNGGRMRMSKIYGNSTPTTIQLSNGGTLRQSLINNNEGQKIIDMYDGRLVNCDIVSNRGTAVTLSQGKSSLINNIIWNNDSSIHALVEIADTTIRNCAIQSDTAFADSTLIALSQDNDQVRFINPAARGIEGLNDEFDWHLNRGSVCIDKGERLSESVTDGDLDRSLRCRNGVIDLGCYETNYPVSIDEVENHTLAVYPNPATSVITVNGLDNGMVQLFDMTGRLVLQQRCSQGSITLSIENLPNGVYYIKQNSTLQKVVKQ